MIPALISIHIAYMISLFALVGWALYAFERNRVKILKAKVEELSTLVTQLQLSQASHTTEISTLTKKLNTQADEHTAMLRIITKVDKLFNFEDDEKDTTKGL